MRGEGEERVGERGGEGRERAGFHTGFSVWGGKSRGGGGGGG